MEELSKMDQINNLAFDIMHATNQGESFDRAAEIYKLSLQPKLNENQRIVLEWLKEEGDPNITVMLWQLTDDVLESQSNGVEMGKHVAAWKSLTDKQKFEVLAAFAEWGMKEVAE